MNTFQVSHHKILHIRCRIFNSNCYGGINMQSRIYGYIRVSSKDQNEDRQIIAMKEFGIPKKDIICDKQSGKDFERPGYKQLMKK